MTEGWVDCPSLGPGWQRREVLRKNGTRPGQSDTYYTSPRGEKIRSRVELLRLLGGSRDLTDFDFKKGIFVDPSAEPQLLQPLPPTGGGHQRVKKGSKRHLPPLAAATPPLKKPPDLLVFEEPPDKELLDQKPPKLELELPVEAPAAILAEQQELLVAVDQPAMKPHKRRCRKHLPALLPPGKMGSVTVEEANPEEPVVCCASCQGQFPGVMLPSQRRCRWLCPDCRAQRRDFNREQRYYKQIGCGVCQACQMSQDCGICSVCVLRAKSPELRIGIKCLLRRCLKIVKKGLECGMCQACKTTEDCGSCRICLRRQKPGMKRQWKCLKRRCLKRKKKIPPKKDGYSTKKLTVDGPAPKVQRAPRGRHKRLSAAPPASTKWKPTMERDPGGIPTVRQRKKQLGAVKERKKPGRPPKHPTAQLKNNVTSASRRNRKCGKCEACLLKMDCGRCDFCCDKPKFGGRNLKRQKCRWRQCLHFAMKRLLPEEWSSPEGAAGWKVRRRRNAFGNRKPTRIKQVGRRGAKGSGQKRRAKASFQPEESPSSREQVHLPRLQSPEEPEQQPAVKWKNEPEMSGSILAQDLAKDRPILPHVKEESEVPRHPTPPSQVLVKQSDTRRPAVSLIATSPVDKREHAEAEGDHQPSKDSPVSAGLPQCKRGGGTQGKELVVLDDEDDEEVEHLQQLRPPVIMEIYSLGGAQPLAQLDSVLHELLAELNEIPLPAHWEVLSPLCGPDLRLVQRSEHSTVSSAAIYIRPGLFFQVVVRNLPVPPEHELYASHPARLTTVDEVVELICDLEAYRLCSGWPAGWHAGQRSEACDVLVYSGCCPQCRLNPWPSGRGAR
ncbi:methyl-CpG-binding domain protein 1 isoform X5 [Zootoca vivipara]|uniref:methyl-CpG-binding domain protein 1 isoform X5 n=1 Tax=Zootoca vivipara TaxID=8524 RepID=UPI001591A752|nr:methyl-CpG-binding domain protein 1 isoform X5 [Zootoca vivipara]